MVANRIDFIGPPGAGKTSLINAIHNLENDCKARSNLIPQILSNCYRKERLSFLDLLQSLYHQVRGEKRVSGIDTEKLRFFYSDHFDVHRHVLHSAYQRFSEDEEELEFVKLVRMQLLYNVLKDQLLLQHHQHSTSVGLFDDSFSNMLLLSILSPNIGVEEFKKWAEPIRSTHFPDGVIYLKTNCEMLFRRLKSRKRKNSSHLHLDDDELRTSLQRQIDLYEKTEVLLHSIGVPVLKISTSRDQSTYVKESIEFISSL